MDILIEHALTPGKTYGSASNPCLILGGGYSVLNEMVDINESTDNAVKTVKFRGKFQEAEAVNKNKRVYPKAVLEENVKRLKEALDAGGLVGELDHPTDSIIHFKDASHKVTKLWWEGNTLMGEGVILNTPGGKVLRALINDGVRVGISSRGVGNGKVNEEGILVIGESYKMITFDVVADPSTYAAFQERVSSGKNETTYESEPLINNYSASSNKNETSSINTTVSKERFLAAFSGIVNQKAHEIKKRLS